MLHASSQLCKHYFPLKFDWIITLSNKFGSWIGTWVFFAVSYVVRRPKYKCTFQTDLTWFFFTISIWRFIKHPFEWHEHFIFSSCWQCQLGTLYIMPIPKQIYLNLNLTLDSLIVSHQKMQFWSSVINRVYEISVLWLVRLIAPGETSYKDR